MYVAVCRINLHIYASRSLKDRRQVVQSVTARLRGKFPIAVADVGDQDTWQSAIIGIAAVSGNPTLAREIVTAAASYAQSIAPEAEVTLDGVDVFDYGE
ncbi:MAG: DUF503 domain-containing protein [Dehalococcoidia bacterium]|nr:DUF503 domain-containing protein [Dehalococcoidia bacterium]